MLRQLLISIICHASMLNTKTWFIIGYNTIPLPFFAHAHSTSTSAITQAINIIPGEIDNRVDITAIYTMLVKCGEEETVAPSG